LSHYRRCGEPGPVTSQEITGEIVTAALAHLGAATPPEFLVDSTDLHNYVAAGTGLPVPATKDGKLYAPDASGLGAEADFDSLGEPAAVYGR